MDIVDYLSEARFRDALSSATRVGSAVTDLELQLRPILLNHIPSTEPVTEQELFVNWAFTLDAWIATGDPSSVRQLAASYQAILDAGVDCRTRARLGTLAERAGRLVEEGTRYLRGHLSRTSWVSFISELPWPSDTKAAILRLDPSELTGLFAAFQTGSYREICSLLEVC